MKRGRNQRVFFFKKKDTKKKRKKKVVKLADFGCAREIRSAPPYTDYVSTRWHTHHDAPASDVGTLTLERKTAGRERHSFRARARLKAKIESYLLERERERERERYAEQELSELETSCGFSLLPPWIASDLDVIKRAF